MKRILLLSYYFPPIGGAGVQRPAKFAKYLPSVGYLPVVVSGPGNPTGRWTPRDETLSGEIPPQTEVLRVAGPEPPISEGWRRRAERWLWLSSPWERWWIDGAVTTGRRSAGADAIYAVMSPYASAEAAAKIAAALGKPWIADLGDPWALDEMMVYPSSLHRRREVTRMRRALASAEAIVMSTPEAALQVRRHFPELAEKLIVAIPNGFDATDFDGPVPERRDGKFRIVHTGYLHTELGRRQRQTAFAHWLLGGEIRGVDILTRSHIYLLEAIERLIEREPALASTIEVHLAGVLSREDREVAERSSVVRMLGYLPHADSVALLRSADLLFLPMQNLPRGKRATIVPGKTYEYLASGRPILAAVPDGDARDILSAAGNCRFTSPDDSAAIADEIAAEIDRWSAGRGIREPAPEVVRRYERRFLTAELAALMDAVTALPTADRLQPARGISPTRVPSRVTQSSVEA